MFKQIYNYTQHIKNFLLISTLFLTFTPTANAYEDYLIISNGKLTDISIEDNTVVDVYPIITLMNDKNTLMVTPLKAGKTRVCVLKNNKDIVMFNIEVTKDKTLIDNVNGFDILSLDIPNNDEDELDEPPKLWGAK